MSQEQVDTLDYTCKNVNRLQDLKTRLQNQPQKEEHAYLAMVIADELAKYYALCWDAETVMERAKKTIEKHRTFFESRADLLPCFQAWEASGDAGLLEAAAALKKIRVDRARRETPP